MIYSVILLGLLVQVMYFLFVDFLEESRTKEMRVYTPSSKKAKLEAGVRGELEVAKLLSTLDREKYTVINGVVVQGEYATEFDHIVVTDKAIFHVETKNYGGHIRIDQNGNWIRERYGTMDVLPNPRFQIARQEGVLKSIFGDSVPIIPILVIANHKTTIEGINNTNLNVMKSGQLIDFIHSLEKNSTISFPWQRAILTKRLVERIVAKRLNYSHV